ncbi:Transglutaminase-like superfamily protein [Chitinophaga jiangningensis]|uniref:Transglutaminase-like superfamily protein n=1 Tax=Chitinophaga jiangningensis TaxID=1419482 RepID=A0A1M7KVZ0_9BACT|nr:DUF3857 and transglutaminase domain-containing protein [Chitinophaga jiangningensis]SHM69234.1 Transglutaminase-like superfamily protein [Chitinophaga jiangningensis]
MRYQSVALAFIASCLLSVAAVAQDGSKMKFGKVDPAEFNLSFDKDTGAHAILISEIGSSSFETTKGDLGVVFRVHRRYKVVDKAGFEYGEVSISLDKVGRDMEEVSKIKAASYNMENGKMVTSTLDSKDIFTEKVDDMGEIKKFAIPGVKVGSIIEYSYTITYPYWHLIPAWKFQHSIPTLWSEYTVGIPEFTRFMRVGQGYIDFEVNSKRDYRASYNFRYEPQGGAGASQNYTMTANVTEFRLGARNVMPIRPESFITSVNNYVAQIKFQLAATNFDGVEKAYSNTWPKLMEELNKNQEFGAAMEKNNNFMDNTTNDIIKGATTDEEKARRIFNWVKSNVVCTDDRALGTTQKLKTTLTSKKGAVSDINLLLVGLLRRANLNAYPVILSTRDHGYVSFYPLLSSFNYVIAVVEIDGQQVKLDASHPLLGFNKLMPETYNGDARVVDGIGTAISISADSLREIAITTISMERNAEGAFVGKFQKRPTYLQSYNIRNTIKDKKLEGYKESLQKAFGEEIEISNATVADLDSLDASVMVDYDFKMNNAGNDDILYIKPMMGEEYKHNIFKSEERKFPVEMNAVMDEIYTLNLAIPEGYVVDELPKSSMVKFNDDEGFFQYLIQDVGGRIQMRSRIKFNKATFLPEDYASLREFYDVVVKKQAEQIVLKKKA